MNVKTVLLSGAGFLLLALGAIGLLIPVWPTTPFVLVAAGCFANNPKLQARIMSVPFFREYLTNYKDRKGLSRKTVAISLVFLWGMLLVSTFFARSAWVAGGLLLVGIAVTVHIVWIARPRK
jgi:uncharacterized protein